MIAVCNGGPMHAHGFPFPDVELDLMTAGPLRYQLVTIAAVGNALERHLSTRQGFHPEMPGAAAVYIVDRELTLRHGWIFTNAGRRIPVLLYTLEPRWTARLRSS